MAMLDRPSPIAESIPGYRERGKRGFSLSMSSNRFDDVSGKINPEWLRQLKFNP
jgi:hypothetical protein